ncbi:hypothetical protein [Pseudohongiella spirulinae]|uniref:Uncharacterized protein n=1 Tax=Pseudohongiella spirulinae TaxID=1249552 RepID=A0A0S2KFR0_9GAMM|nr:hypothetical protein [Pseudohongiella spirulinae]ALO47114.1 hypothetical protein PS2015_2480 [Pseudohongiella spirulinae]
MHDSIHDSAKQVQQARDAIVASGCLGRSPVYARLLDYLLNCARAGHQPKEFDIAVDVLGRDSSFDVARDSVVRVYIHKLRQRLEKYYEQHEATSQIRFEIPKGQYVITLREPSVTQTASSEVPITGRGNPILRSRLPWILLAVVLASGNLWQWFWPSQTHNGNLQQLIAQSPWQAMQDDELPIMVVMGDYYIFGELDEEGRIARMVRDFFINSRDDLMTLFMQDSDLQNYFRDLDMTYMPEGSANALMDVAPLIREMNKPIHLKMMSRVTTSDLRNNHIVYIGYISAMDKLNNLFFNASGLLPGSTFDELYEKNTGTLYRSNAGLPEQGQPFRDLALLASWPGSSGNQFVLISGTRDAGLVHAAKVATQEQHLQALEDTSAFEALYDVYGIDRTNFDSSLIYQKPLSPERIWSLE